MNELNANSKVILNNGSQMPVIGFGTFRIPEGDEVVNAVKTALEAGYRFIDTAMMYKNEEGVGKAIKESGIPREEIFVTTKLWNTDQGYDTTLKAIDASLAKLGLTYVDLYLIHWPTASDQLREGVSIDKRQETWRAMEEIYKSGKAKAIGVANYMLNHLEEMKNYAKIIPMVNQFEFHPFLYQRVLLDYCKNNNIVVQAHSPFADNKGHENQIVKGVAQKYGKSTNQVFVRWSMQHGAVPIPKSIHKERIVENLDVFNFKLSEEDMKTLDGLSVNMHVRADPNLFK